MIRQPSHSDAHINPDALKDIVSHVKKSQAENSHTWYDLKEKEVISDKPRFKLNLLNNG